MDSYQDINAKSIGSWIKQGWEWGQPISHEVFMAAKRGDWGIVLTPQRIMPHSWLEPFYKNKSLNGATLIGLASGGGQQMPIFAALGADCTVMDITPEQLESERAVSQREGYKINIVQGDMTKTFPFDDKSFDIICHPVSNVYVEDVHHVWRECYRVLKPGGIIVSGLDNGINYLFLEEPEDEADGPLIVQYPLPFNPLQDPMIYDYCMRNDLGIQFSHTIEEQLGGQLKAGLVLTDLYEDRDNLPGIGRFYPQYIASRARRPE